MMSEQLNIHDPLHTTLIEESDCAIALFNRDIKYLYANLKWKEFFNLTSVEPGKTLFNDHTSSYDVSSLERAILLGLSGKKTAQIEIELQTSAGFSTVKLSALPVTDSDPIAKVAATISFSDSPHTYSDEASSALLQYLNLSDSIYLRLNRNMTIELINEAGARLIGHTRSELIGQNWIETAIPADLRETYERMYNELFNGNIKAFHSMDCSLKSSNNTIRTISCHHSLVRDQENRIIALLANGSDITPVKRTETRLKNSEEKFKALADSIDDLLLSVNHSLQITYWNPVIERISGISAREADGKAIEDVITQFKNADLLSSLTGTIDTGRTHNRIKDVSFKGIEYTIDFSFFPFKQGATILARNISSQIRFQEQIFEQAQILDQLNEAVITTDKAGLILTANSPCIRIFKKPISELLESEVVSLFHPQSQNHMKEVLNNLTDDNAFASDEFIIQIDKKLSFPALVHISKKVNINNEKMGYIFSIIDISETVAIRREIVKINQNLERTIQKRTMELEEAKQRSEQSNKSKSNILANMSHEVRTPMNTIVGLNQMLEKSQLDPRQRKYTEKIAESSTRLLKIINNILDYSRLETGTFNFDYHDFSVNNLLQRLKAHLTELIGLKNIAPLFIISPDIPQIIHSDPSRFQQAVEILLDNAVKFTESGEIILSMSSTTVSDKITELKIAIQDTGIGIGEEMNHQIFTPFTQADTSKTRKYGGAGIGLALCRQIVRNLGGSVTFRSTQGIGTTFTITIQVKEGQGSGPTEKALPEMNILFLESRENYKKSVLNIIPPNTRSTALDNFSPLSDTDPGYIDKHNFNILITNTEIITTSYTIVKNMFINKGLPVICYKTFNYYIPDQFTHGIFYLTLPLLQSDLHPLLKQTLMQSSPRLIPQRKINDNKTVTRKLKGTRVLIVDDNKINIEILTELLNSHGIQTESAPNGKEALVKIESEIFDIVLLDIKMPVMNGFETIEKIRNEKKLLSLPVLALSADTSRYDIETYHEKGMNGYIRKPFNLNELFSTLSQWVNVRSEEEQSDKIRHKTPVKSIDGINIRKLIHKINAEPDKIHDIFEIFYKNNKNRLGELKQLHKEKRNEELKTVCHNLLAVSGNIEANDLHNAVKLYKKSLCAENYSKLNFLFADLCFQLERILTSISKYLAVSEQLSSEKRPSDERPLFEELQKLEEYLLSSDTRALIYIDELLRSRFNPEITAVMKEIKNYCLKFDFDAAYHYFYSNKKRIIVNNNKISKTIKQ
jgi:PAS domain S-box-containing protein